jgi:hypothetical protein
MKYERILLCAVQSYMYPACNSSTIYTVRCIVIWISCLHCRKAFEWNQLVWNKFQLKYPNKTNLEPAQCERSSILGSMPNPAVGGGDRRVSRPHQVQSWHAGPRWRSPSCLKRSDNCLTVSRRKCQALCSAFADLGKRGSARRAMHP